MAQKSSQPSYTDCVYQVMEAAQRPLSVAEIVERVNEIRLLTAKKPESTVRSALSKSSLIQRVGSNLYAYMPTILKGNRFRHVLTRTELETGELAVDYDLFYALWPSHGEARKRRTVGQVTLHLRRGATVTAQIEQFTDGSWGTAENDEIRAWLGKHGCKVEDNLIFEVLDVTTQEYRVTVRKAKKRKKKQIRKRNAQVAEAALNWVSTTLWGSFISRIAIALISESLYASKIPPDPLTIVLDDDGRFTIDEMGLVYPAPFISYDDEFIGALGDMVFGLMPEAREQFDAADISGLLRDFLAHPERYPDVPSLPDLSFEPLAPFAWDDWDEDWEEEDEYLEDVEHGYILPFTRSLPGASDSPKLDRAGLNEAEFQEIFQRLTKESTRQDEARVEIRKLRMHKRQVIPRLIELLQSPNRVERQVAMLVLIELGDRSVIPKVENLLYDVTLDDSIKFVVISALMGLRADLSPDEMLAQLRDPARAMRQSMKEMLANMGREAERAQFLETLQNYPPEVLERVVANLGASEHEHALYVLLPLLHYPDDGVVLTAIAALDELKNPAAIPALQELAVYEFGPDIGREAHRVIGRLTMRASVREEAGADETAPRTSFPLRGVWISTIDGNGSQLAIVARQRPDTYLQMLNVTFNDYQGIKDCFGADMMSEEELDDIFIQAGDAGIALVEVSLAPCRRFLTAARRINLEAGYPIPLEYEVWKGFLEPGEADDVVEGMPPTVDLAKQPELLTGCAGLLELEEFSSWFFDPAFWEDYEEARRALRRARGRERERRRAEIIRRGLADIVDDEFRRLLSARLRHQAWLLARLYTDELGSQWAMAAAAGLEGGAGIPLHEHPLLYGMMKRTLETPLEALLNQMMW